MFKQIYVLARQLVTLRQEDQCIPAQCSQTLHSTSLPSFTIPLNCNQLYLYELRILLDMLL